MIVDNFKEIDYCETPSLHCFITDCNKFIIVVVINLFFKMLPRPVKRSKRRVTIMVMSVITAYVVCWSPYWVMQIMMIFVDRPMALLFNFLTILNYANSALNPLLYAFLSATFRRNFAHLFGCQGFIPVLATAVTS